MRLLWDLNVFKKGTWSSEAVYYCSNCHGLRAEDHAEPHWLLFEGKASTSSKIGDETK
ncbi:MAG: hypothetical protein ACLP5V_03130 [Candidatus Bathyarchaeia archaeon]|jgi:hypothetical protein